MLPALSNPPSRCERTAAHLVYENLSVNPVVARLRKLTIMQMWRVRCSRVKRTNWRSATLPLGVAVLLASGPSETSPLGIGLLLGVFLGAGFAKSAVCFGQAAKNTGSEVPDVFTAVFEYSGLMATWTLNYCN